MSTDPHHVTEMHRLAECECGGRHLVSNIRFMASMAQDDSGAADLDFSDCRCECCQWLSRTSA